MMTAVLPAPPAFAGLTWTQVERGFHVAYRGDAFAGFVETTVDGSLVAFDEFSSPIGRYASLVQAKQSLHSTATPANERRRARRRRVRQTAAAAAGALAGALLLTAGVLAPYL